MSIAMNRHCIPGLTMSTALTGNFLQGVRELIKTMHHRVWRVRITCQRPSADTEETERYDSRGKICVVFPECSQ